MTHGAGSLRVFGRYRGADVHQVALGSPDGLQAKVMTWGAVLCDLSLPRGGGARLPLTLGFETFEPYPIHSPYFGAVVGRYANRIAGGQYSHAGQTHLLDRNEASRTTLHGGAGGFSQRVWRIDSLAEDSVKLGLTSADGDQGFPGTLRVTCTYTLVGGLQLDVQFRATTDQATPVNLAQHSYFNLDGGRDTSDHQLQIFAESYTPVGQDQIPTGGTHAVEGTVFDFRQPKVLRQKPHAFDHNFVLSDAPSGVVLRPAAMLASRQSGIKMLVETTKPGLQFYDGSHIQVPVLGHGGRTYDGNLDMAS
ncbi:MAG: aldose epimerase family protein, partial [Paracoccaceae bacterium]